MSKKSKSTTNETSHTVVTPTNPDWVTNPVQGLAGQIGDLSKLDPNSLVAGVDPLQNQARAWTSNLGGFLTPTFDQYNANTNQARGLINDVYRADAPQVSAARANGYVNDYLSPYLNDIVKSSLADYDFGAGQTQAQNRLALANDDTFGGSGGVIQTALSNDAITRGRANLAAGLRNQGYTTALGAAQSDAERAQQAAITNAQLQDTTLARRLAAAGQLGTLAENQAGMGLNFDTQNRNDAQAMATLGDSLRQIQQQQLQAPLSLLGTQTSLLNQLPLSLFHGQVQDGTGNSTTTTKSSDPLGALATIMTLPWGGSTVGGTIGK
jgi:hypothetical protein